MSVCVKIPEFINQTQKPATGRFSLLRAPVTLTDVGLRRPARWRQRGPHQLLTGMLGKASTLTGTRSALDGLGSQRGAR